MKIQGATLKFHVYRLTTESAATETMKNDDEDIPVSSHWMLPAQEFHHLWESLYFDSNIKENVGRIYLTFYNSRVMFYKVQTSLCSSLVTSFRGNGDDICRP